MLKDFCGSALELLNTYKQEFERVTADFEVSSRRLDKNKKKLARYKAKILHQEKENLDLAKNLKSTRIKKRELEARLAELER